MCQYLQCLFVDGMHLNLNTEYGCCFLFLFGSSHLFASSLVALGRGHLNTTLQHRVDILYETTYANKVYWHCTYPTLKKPKNEQTVLITKQNSLSLISSHTYSLKYVIYVWYLILFYFLLCFYFQTSEQPIIRNLSRQYKLQILEYTLLVANIQFHI